MSAMSETTITLVIVVGGFIGLYFRKRFSSENN
jgi:hypothetical protein